MRYIGVIILCLSGVCSFGQSTQDDTQQSSTTNTDYVEWHGVLDGHMPVRIAFELVNNEASGYIEYGENKDRYDLLGSIEDDQLDIYQFDDYSKVMCKMSGDLGNAKHNWTWSNEAKTSIKTLHPRSSKNNLILLYESEEHDLIIRPNTRSIIGGDQVDDLKWSSYDCSNQDCTVIDSNRDPGQFQWDGSEMLTVDYNNEKYTQAHKLKYALESYHDSKIAYSFYYPILEDEKFDAWIIDQMSACRTNYNNYRNQGLEASDQLLFIGDFYISAYDERIISGYLNWSCNTTASVETVPFIYDYERSKFYKVNDLLRSDFDYAFFLEQFLKKEKTKSLREEDYLIRSALKQKHFKHYVLTHQGIVFFTDFNTLFGRRSILVPYKEFQGFVDNKNISNYFKKRV